MEFMEDERATRIPLSQKISGYGYYEERDFMKEAKKEA